MSRSAEALYLYALCPVGVQAVLQTDRLPDTIMGPVSCELIGGVSAVVSVVLDLEAWSDESRLASVEWVTPRAIHHADVIESVWRQYPVYPARFGTLFTSRAALAERVAPFATELKDFFTAVDGRGEWDVKIFFDPEQAEALWMDRQLESEAGVLSALPTGRRYLAEQKLRREARRDLAPVLIQRCQELAAGLINGEDGLRERALPAGDDPQRRPLAHWALLWPLQQKDELQRRLTAATELQASCGLQLQWTGPWPPYSFRPTLVGNEI